MDSSTRKKSVWDEMLRIMPRLARSTKKLNKFKIKNMDLERNILRNFATSFSDGIVSAQCSYIEDLQKSIETISDIPRIISLMEGFAYQGAEVLIEKGNGEYQLSEPARSFMELTKSIRSESLALFPSISYHPYLGLLIEHLPSLALNANAAERTYAPTKDEIKKIQDFFDRLVGRLNQKEIRTKTNNRKQLEYNNTNNIRYYIHSIINYYIEVSAWSFRLKLDRDYRYDSNIFASSSEFRVYMESDPGRKEILLEMHQSPSAIKFFNKTKHLPGFDKCLDKFLIKLKRDKAMRNLIGFVCRCNYTETTGYFFDMVLFADKIAGDINPPWSTIAKLWKNCTNDVGIFQVGNLKNDRSSLTATRQSFSAHLFSPEIDLLIARLTLPDYYFQFKWLHRSRSLRMGIRPNFTRMDKDYIINLEKQLAATEYLLGKPNKSKEEIREFGILFRNQARHEMYIRKSFLYSME